MAQKERAAVSAALKTLPGGEKHTAVHTCFRESPVPRREILWSDGTRDDEGEGKHYGEAEEQGEEEDCGPPVGQFGKTQDLLTTLLLQLRCGWCSSRLSPILSRLQWVALTGTACGLHCRLNALPARKSTDREKSLK